MNSFVNKLNSAEIVFPTEFAVIFYISKNVITAQLNETRRVRHILIIFIKVTK